MAAYTAIDNSELYFQIKLYTGNGTDDTAITLDGSENMQPDWVWIRKRNATEDFVLFDSVRGATKYIKVNVNEAEATDTGSLKAFASDGFTLGTAGRSNNNTNTFAAWCWKESADAGFDILTYVGDNQSGTTVAHALSAIPHWMLIKNLNSAEKPAVYHKSVASSSPEDYFMTMSDTTARYDDGSFLNDTAPTSSIFTLGNTQGISESGSTMVAYLWTSIQGYSKFGSFIGNGGTGTSGPFVYTGFRPAFVMIKKTSAVGSWLLFDNKRASTSNIPEGTTGVPSYLEPNTTGTEQGDNPIFLFANGFQCLDSLTNTDGADYMFMAFAEAPFVNSNGVPCTAR